MTTQKNSKRQTKKSPILIITLILTLLSPSKPCTKETLDFSKYLKIPRSPSLLKMDQFIPIHDSTIEATYSDLKVLADISGLKSLSSADQVKYEFVTEALIPSLKEYIARTFKVKEKQKIGTSDTDCAEFQIPSSYRTSETDAGLILFFTSDAKSTDNFVAWAAPCSLHGTTLRPIMGRVNLNPKFISNEKKKFFDQFATILHEVFHVMGFSKSLYPYFIDKNTYKRIPLSDTLLVKDSGAFRHRIKSPRVLRYGKTYFNCDSLDGVPLEDEGSEGSAGSHWEKIALGNEVMVANTVANPVISMFTLSLLEDSGWYEIDYRNEEPFFWGKNAGCGIVDGKCPLHGNPCTKAGDEGCFYDFTFQAECASDTFSNYCKFFTSTDFNQHDCRASDNYHQNEKGLGEAFGPGSRCFQGELSKGVTVHKNLCFKAMCIGSSVSISIAGTAYNCYTSGEKIYPKELSGFVTCPDVEKFCEQNRAACPEDCNLVGRCLVGNKCSCYKDYEGDSCKEWVGKGVPKVVDKGAPKPNSNDDYGTYTSSSTDAYECPNNCSGIGVCKYGTCYCKNGYSGVDCSVRTFGGLVNLFGNGGSNGLGRVSELGFVVLVWALLIMVE